MLCALVGALHLPIRAGTDEEIIRLRPPATQSAPDPALEPPVSSAPLVDVAGPRRGFDYHAFEARLESLWFQRKTLLADGRRQDAAEQSQLMRSFCAEEGVRRVEGLASALLSEIPDLKALLCTNDSMALGAVAALKSADRRDVLVVGFDNITAVRELVKDGRILATADQHGDQLAVFGIEYALEMLKTKGTPKSRETPVDLITTETLR